MALNQAFLTGLMSFRMPQKTATITVYENTLTFISRLFIGIKQSLNAKIRTFCRFIPSSDPALNFV